MSDESVLPARAREVMKAGNLPNRRPDRVWGGPGNGETCAVCGKTIGTKEVEIELQFTSEGGSGTASYHAHAQCFGAWEHERRNGSSGDSLPQGGDAGMMPSREPHTTNPGERG